MITVVFIAIRGNEIVNENRRLTAERDKLFSHTLAQSIAVYVETNVDAIERLAGSAKQQELTFDNLYPSVENAALTSRAFFAMSIADANGVIIAGCNKLGESEEDRRLVGINISDRDYYKKVIATRKTVVSDAITARVAPYVPTIAIAVPLFDEQNNLSGMAIGGLSLEPLYRLAEAALGSEFAIPVVIDQQGQVIVHSNSTFVKEHKLLKDFGPAELALKGEEGFLDAFIDTDGVERSAAYTPVPELGWGVWIAQDTKQFSEAAQRVAVASAILGLATFLGVFLIFLILSRIIFRPLNRLITEVVDLTEKNQFDKKVGVTQAWRTKETAELEDKFNLLIEKIQKSFEEQKENLRVKSQFLTVTTHAFRTPLNVLQWTLDSIRNEISSYPNGQKNTYFDLYESTQRLILGFENLFTALEIQEKTARVDYKEVDLTALIRNVIAKLTPLIEKKNLLVNFPASSAVIFAGDENKTRRLAEILFSNALFYNREGGTIDIELREEKDMVLLVVKDSGIGIPPEERPHLFEEFFRGKLAAKMYPDGTGLGLFIAKSFVDLHHGSIEVSSQEGESTTVTVRLPRRVTLS